MYLHGGQKTQVQVVTILRMEQTPRLSQETTDWSFRQKQNKQKKEKRKQTCFSGWENISVRSLLHENPNLITKV